MRVTVCICTFQRPALLKRLLAEVSQQDVCGQFQYCVVVADNDALRSAEPVVLAMAAGYPVKLTYCCEPVRNIALARNKALSCAKGEFVAFIDDDEFPVANWLRVLLGTCNGQGVGGVLGPVLPRFEGSPPSWVLKGAFCSRPRHPTGFLMNWRECRTGNVLLKREMLDGLEEPFRAEFGTGGEDVDFFRRMMQRGHSFIWCDEAVVYETVPPHRWRRAFMLRRALLRGQTAWKQPEGRWLGIAKTIIAIPLYTMSLPILLLVGHHWYMKCLVRLCDHLGKMLAMLGMHLVRERIM